MRCGTIWQVTTMYVTFARARLTVWFPLLLVLATVAAVWWAGAWLPLLTVALVLVAAVARKVKRRK